MYILGAIILLLFAYLFYVLFFTFYSIQINFKEEGKNEFN